VRFYVRIAIRFRVRLPACTVANHVRIAVRFRVRLPALDGLQINFQLIFSDMCWQAVVIGVRRITKTLTPLYANGARNCPYDSYAELDTCRRTLKQGFKPTLGPTLVWSLNFSFRLSGPSDILVCEDGVPCSYLRDVSGMQPDLNNVLATPEAPSMAQLLAEFFRYVPQWVGNHWEWRVRQTVWESMTANCVWEGLKFF
jgi:hypothetical protein